MIGLIPMLHCSVRTGDCPFITRPGDIPACPAFVCRTGHEQERRIMNVLHSATPVSFLYVSDRDRALAFYCETLGFALHSSDPFGDFIDLGGAIMRMTVMPDLKAHPHPVLGWNVDDIEA